MNRYNKVVWSEGLFLHPQLFQQQERHLEHAAHVRALPLSPFFWGCSALEVDNDLLALGKVALRVARGLFPDGTPFDAPGNDPLPEPLTVLPSHVEQAICLILPLSREGVADVTFEDLTRTPARYTVFHTDVPDDTSLGMPPQTVQLARLRMRLVPEQEVAGDCMALPVARILDVDATGCVRLDPEFVAASSSCSASGHLSQWLTEIHGLVRLRAEDLAAHLTGAGREASEVTDYLLLQTLNRYEPLLGHVSRTRHLSPESLYTLLLSLDGELSTFLRFRTRRPDAFPDYRHDRPGIALYPLVADLRLLLNIVLERSAQRIPLIDQQYGRFLAMFDAGTLTGFSSLVLSVAARLPREALQQTFPIKTKIGPPEYLAQLVHSHVPGIVLQPLPLAPRQIPFTAEAVYFELRREGSLWERVRNGGGLGLHVAGDFPGLQLELWGIRER